ncbi:MAG: hypothetical protein KatS3mg005_1728 [Bryobacteraceae bacterium]|nr:MAG: hypothetical protein KatS3mg005_1728 [Bryobacteraceae bacterium]
MPDLRPVGQSTLRLPVAPAHRQHGSKPRRRGLSCGRGGRRPRQRAFSGRYPCAPPQRASPRACARAASQRASPRARARAASQPCPAAPPNGFPIALARWLHPNRVPPPLPTDFPSALAEGCIPTVPIPSPEATLPQHPTNPKTAILRNEPKPAPPKQSRAGAARRAATKRFKHNLPNLPTPSPRAAGAASPPPLPTDFPSRSREGCIPTVSRRPSQRISPRARARAASQRASPRACARAASQRASPRPRARAASQPCFPQPRGSKLP